MHGDAVSRWKAWQRGRFMRRLAIARQADELHDLLARITADHPCENPQCVDYRAEIRQALARIDGS